jgi:hypothetical protein
VGEEESEEKGECIVLHNFEEFDNEWRGRR